MRHKALAMVQRIGMGPHIHATLSINSAVHCTGSSGSTLITK